jgi:hypothetical protein
MKPFYIKFNVKYFTLSLILLLIETLIALYVHDKIIRPHIGDVLVVILIYCLIKSFINIPKLYTALIVLIFAFCIETLQYFKFINIIGLEKSKLAQTIIGTSFDWLDLINYSIGIILVVLTENLSHKFKSKV